MVKAREDRLAALADKISVLRRARDNAVTQAPPLPAEEIMGRKRELIDTGTDKRYVRRNERGTSFVESDDVSRSLASDRTKPAKTKVKSGEGDKGDRPRAKTKRKAVKKASRKAAARKGAARKSAGKTRAKRRR